eukprot:g6597.t1
MDIDGPPDVGGGDGKKRLRVRDEGLLQQDSAAVSSKPTVELPDVRAPVELPQPGEWLQVPSLGGMTDSPLPLNSQVPSTGLKVDNGNGKAMADPFAVQDNDYADSFLDSLWINLLSSRMAVAVEAEAFNVKERKEGVAGNGISSGSARGKTNAKGSGLTKSAPEGAAAGTVAEEEARRTFSMTRPSGGGMGGGYTYDDYVALATRLQAGAPERQREVVRGVLRSVFPEWFPAFYRTLFPPSKFSAQVNAFMCPPLFGWLVGKSELADGVVDIEAMQGRGPTQEVWRNTVKVERCRYLEASKCKGTCMNLCKLPTEAFFRQDLGMPLRMTPNFEDLSCEFAFGQDALPADEDPLMQEPCWTECLSSGKQPKKPQRACHTMPESPLRGP